MWCAVKPNRQKKTSDSGLTHVGFKADRAALEDIAVLVAAQRKRGSVAPKSAAIRAGLRFAAEHIRAGKEL